MSLNIKKINNVWILLFLLSCTRTLVNANFSQPRKKNNWYQDFSALSTHFRVKGKIKGQSYYYQGRLHSNKKKTLIYINDSLFRSPLYKVSIQDEKIIQKDFLKNETNTYLINKYFNPNFFGQEIPFYHFLSIISGRLPFSFETKGVKWEKGKAQYKTDDGNFILYFNAERPVSLAYLNREKKLWIDFFFKGNLGGLHYFPEELIIKARREPDYLQIKFDSLKIQPLDVRNSKRS